MMIARAAIHPTANLLLLESHRALRNSVQQHNNKQRRSKQREAMPQPGPRYNPDIENPYTQPALQLQLH